ncbi:MAG: SusC/RagA family TonB-linked outer membrane protein, partial [Chitinophagaceae bacterium]
MSKTIAMKLTMLLVLFLHCVLFTHAQTRTVTGRITDAEGKGVPGVTVSVKGTTSATQTSDDGSYSISVSDNSTLVFSSVGYASVEERVGTRSNISTTINTENAALSEVVVVGYATVRRRDQTGAVTTVTEKDFNKGTYTSADQLIQGKVAGVQVTNNSGQPGGAATVKIRGNSALTGSGSPLYVIDGVPLDGRSPRPGVGDIGVGGSNPGSNPLNFINPADIASMEILKDASATAIYGSRAAYGVVLITTKKGQSGQPKIDFGASYGSSRVMRRINVLDASQFRSALTYYGVSTTNDKGSDVDAFDAITRTGAVQNYNVGLSGGNENARYRFSVGVLDQEGIVKKSGIKKYTANFSGNFKFLESKKFGLDINIIPSQYKEELAPISNDAGSRGSLIGQALQWNPTEPLIVKRANGSDSLNVRRGGDLLNPLAVQEAITDKSRVTTILASISPSYKFTNWLEYRFLYSINYSTGSRATTVQPFINFNDVQDRGRARLAQSELSTQQFTHTLNFNKKVTERLNLNALAGYEYLDYTSKGFNVNTFGLAGGGFGNFGLDFVDYIQVSDPTNRGVGSYNDPSYEIQSYFGRTVFNYDDKYLLTATMRADGSTRFGKNNKYGYFPSVGVAWNISKEEFYNFDAITNLKLRGGWGKTGNQEF